MNHSIVINSHGITEKQFAFVVMPFSSQMLSQLYNELQKISLKSQRLIMNEADYQDIVAWSNEDNQ